MNKKDKVKFVINSLEKLYPKVSAPLDHKDPYTFLIAVLLSAQSTDAGVNKVTPILFKKADNPYDMIKLTVEDIRYNKASWIITYEIKRYLWPVENTNF